MKRQKFAILLAAVVLGLSVTGCDMMGTNQRNRTKVPITPTMPDVTPDGVNRPSDYDLTPDGVNNPNNYDVSPDGVNNPNNYDVSPDGTNRPNDYDVTPDAAMPRGDGTGKNTTMPKNNTGTPTTNDSTVR